MWTGPAWRDLKGDQKCYQSIGHPSRNQRFDLDFNMIRPPPWNYRKTIHRKLTQSY
jgi:hypothetical protein